MSDLVVKHFDRPKRPEDRLQILKTLQHCGENVPFYGMIGKLASRFSIMDYVVVWVPGESKLLRLAEALNKYSSYYGCIHVGQQGSVATSTKRIQLGPTCYWVDFSSHDDWRSTRGTSRHDIAKVKQGFYHPIIQLPYFSIDYVQSGELIYAIDMDIDPRLGGCLDPVTRKQAASLIKQGTRYFREKAKEASFGDKVVKAMGQVIEKHPEGWTVKKGISEMEKLLGSKSKIYSGS